MSEAQRSVTGQGEELQGKMKNLQSTGESVFRLRPASEKKINKKKKGNFSLSESRARQSLTGTTGTAKAINFKHSAPLLQRSELCIGIGRF